MVKGWKKFKENKENISFRHMKTRNEVRLITNDRIDWLVVYEDVNQQSTSQLNQNIKKTKALKFAKSWMKKHPRG